MLELVSSAQQEWLLDLAGAVICATARGQRLPSVATADPALIRPTAVFATLWQSSPGGGGELQLRGCIGRIEADLPLCRAVIKAAAGAAARDPRFPAVRASELPLLTVELTLLSDMREVHRLDELQVGQHGVVIEAYGRRALLLPKVAPRMKWSRQELLENLCSKAALPVDTWPAAGTLFSFEAQSFSRALAPLINGATNH